MFKPILGDPIDMNALIKSLSIVLLAVAIISVPLIPERCIACNRTKCPVGKTSSLRVLTIPQWICDNTRDLHLNSVCPNFYTELNDANGVK